MSYYMIFLGYRNGKELWRGTGFNLAPGSLTRIGYEATREARQYWRL